MTTVLFNFEVVHPSWRECLERGLLGMDNNYLKNLSVNKEWLPGSEKIFNAFTLALEKVNFVLFGESPYPRKESANGYAFWDNSVSELWSTSGLSKKVNRATSLRNIMKMLLIAEGVINEKNVSQEKIAELDKSSLVQNNHELFSNFIEQGFLLLNATPVLQNNAPLKDAKFWAPFVKELLACLLQKRPQVKFILLGNIANKINTLIPSFHTNRLYAEHPYNQSFISNPDVLAFFKPLHLLRKKEKA